MPDRDGALRFARFVAVGLTSTAIYFVVLIALDRWIARVWLLTSVSYAISMAFNYLAQARYTFRASAFSGASARRYLAMHGAAIAVNAAAMTALVARGAPLLGAQVLVTGVVTLGVFFASRYWVFPSGRGDAAPDL